MIFGYHEDERKGIQDGDIVNVILLDRCYPSAYKKVMDEKQVKLNEASSILGLKPECIPLSHKDGGLGFHFAVIDKINMDDGDVQQLITLNKDSVNVPGYNIFGTYTQYIPAYILENNLGFTNVIKGGINRRYANTSHIVIAQHFPGTLPERDWDIGISADEVKDEDIPAFRHLVSKEKKRLSNWEQITRKWDSETKESAIEKLEEMISSRLLLYHRTENTKAVKYIKPCKGLTFTAKVKKANKYIDLIAFEYNRNTGEYDYFSQGTEYPQEEDLLLAEKLIVAREEYYKNFENKVKETVEEVSPF